MLGHSINHLSKDTNGQLVFRPTIGFYDGCKSLKVDRLNMIKKFSINYILNGSFVKD